MEVKEAEALRKAWGDKPCAHPWWVEETLNGADTGRVACKTCGYERRKGEPAPAPAKGKPTTDAAKAPISNQPVKDLESKTPALDRMIKDLESKAPVRDQPVKDLDAKDITVIQQVEAPDVQATSLNEKVKGLESAADGVVAMLGADFAFTMQDEAKIASVAGKLRDALTRWREKKKRSP